MLDAIFLWLQQASLFYIPQIFIIVVSALSLWNLISRQMLADRKRDLAGKSQPPIAKWKQEKSLIKIEKSIDVSGEQPTDQSRVRDQPMYSFADDQINSKRRSQDLVIAAIAARLRVDDERSHSLISKPAPLGVHALETQRGRLVEKIPRQMQVGVREPVEIRLGTSTSENLMLGLMGSGTLTSHHVDIVETMSIELFSTDGAFQVESASPTTQLVKRDVLLGTPYARFVADFGQWIWYVTPRQRGQHPLSIRISASVLDSKGNPANAALPDRQIDIAVSVNLVRTSSSFTKHILGLAISGTVTGLFGAIVGVLTKDYWWPRIEEVLRGLGVL